MQLNGFVLKYLILLMWFCQHALWDNFSREYLVRFYVHKFITFSETTLQNEEVQSTHKLLNFLKICKCILQRIYLAQKPPHSVFLLLLVVIKYYIFSFES